MGTEVAIAGLIISAASAAGQYVQAKKQEDIQEEQGAVQSAQQDVEMIEARRKQFREQRVRAAQIEQSSAQQGTGGSSGEAGALGALSTNVMANVGMSSGRANTARALTDLSQQYSDSQTTAALWGVGGQVGGAMYKAGEKDFLKLFE